jgi:hypothetical protein
MDFGSKVIFVFYKKAAPKGARDPNQLKKIYLYQLDEEIFAIVPNLYSVLTPNDVQLGVDC